MPEPNEQTPLVTQTQAQPPSSDRHYLSRCFYLLVALVSLASTILEIYGMYLNEQKVEALKACTKDNKNYCDSSQWLYFSDYFARMHHILKITVISLALIATTGFVFMVGTNRRGDAAHAVPQISAYSIILSLLFAGINGVLIPIAYNAKHEASRLSRLSFGDPVSEKSIQHSIIFLNGMIIDSIFFFATVSLPLFMYFAFNTCKTPSSTFFNQYTPPRSQHASLNVNDRRTDSSNNEERFFYSFSY